jgi:hypothetical protein
MLSALALRTPTAFLNSRHTLELEFDLTVAKYGNLSNFIDNKQRTSPLGWLTSDLVEADGGADPKLGLIRQ